MCACMYITHEIIEVLHNGKHTYMSEWVSSLALSCSPSLSLSYKCILTNRLELTCVCVYHDSLKCVT